MALPSINFTSEVEFVAISAGVMYILKLFLGQNKDLKVISYIITYVLFFLIRIYRRVSKSEEFHKSLDKIQSELTILKNKHKSSKIIVG